MQWFRFIRYLVPACIIAQAAVAQPVAPASHKAVTAASIKAVAKSVPVHKVSSSNMWDMMAGNFSIPHYTNTPEVQRQIKWFAEHPKYFEKIAAQGQPYFYYIYQEVKKRHLPGELVLLPMIESAYDPFAYSWVGAAGLWQMMPATGSNFGLKQDWWYDGRKDVMNSTKAALDYLTYLQTFFNNNWLLAIAAYNSGEGTVQNAVDRNAHRGAGTTFWELHLPAETESYVPRLLALAAIVSNPGKYGVALPPIKYGPYFDVVQLKKQIDLSEAAKMAGIPLSQLYELNPGYNRWATDPKGPYTLLLPLSNVRLFEVNYQLAYGDSSIVGSKMKAAATQSAVKNGPSAVTETTLNTFDQGAVVGVSAPAPTMASVTVPAASTNHTTPKPTTTPVINKTLPAPITPPSGSSAAPAAVAAPIATETTYVVKNGDTLWSIAKHFNVTIGQLRTWNKLSEKQRVNVGQKIIVKLPAAKQAMNIYHVQPGDTLFSIARAHNMHLSEIEALNPQLANTEQLSAGMVVNI